MNNQIEVADGDRSIMPAAGSLRRWYGKRHNSLIESDIKTLEALGKETDPVERKKLLEKSNQLKTELDELNAGMRACALANLGENKTARITQPGREQRIAATPIFANVGDPNDPQKYPSGRKKLSGFAALYENEVNIANYFIEKIARGAFAEVIKKTDTRLLFNHDANHIFGRTSSKSLRLYETYRGLFFWGDLLPNDIASDALFARVGRGDISGCSFAFSDVEDDWELPKNHNELPKRTIIKISQLYDVGPVTYPAYPQTSVQATTERTESPGEFIERTYREEDEGWQRRYDLNKLQKRLNEKLNFDQKFEYEKHVRKAERLRNMLNEVKVKT